MSNQNIGSTLRHIHKNLSCVHSDVQNAQWAFWLIPRALILIGHSNANAHHTPRLCFVMNLQIQLEKSGQVLKCIITWLVKAHYIIHKMMSQNFPFFWGKTLGFGHAIK
jgi:hypothetical protein